MTLHVHRLDGCAPTPLAHYLKALGILRLVAEQADPNARGWWHNERFSLLTILDRAELEQFFLERYAPTPFIDPWNGGSGFFPKDNKAGIGPIQRSTAARFAPYREAIVQGMQATAGLKAKPDKKDKPLILQKASQQWRGAVHEWFEAAVVLDADHQPKYPSLLGTGGNDGRLDFTNNAMQRIGELFDLADPQSPAKPPTQALLTQALWSTSVHAMQAGAAIGQFSPGQAGGANASTGADADSLINPWDFVLMLEGSILFSARSTRRLDPLAASHTSAPFAMHSHACGHASPGAEKATRGEQWMPLWSQPTRLTDLAALLGEARLQTGRNLAHRPLDAARAIATLGTARGISAFERFGYLERNGQANLAIPLGRIAVRERPNARLIDDLATWLDRLNRQARGDHAPARLIHAERQLADAVFAALTHDDSPDRWQAILLSAQQIESIQVSGTAIQAGPIPRLTSAWLTAGDDGSATWRLACALASAGAAYTHGRPNDAVRHHWLPLDLKQPWKFQTSDQGKRLMHSVRAVVTGRNAQDDAIAVVQRRLIEAAQHGARQLPLVAAPGFAASWGDLSAVLAGTVDLERILRLAQALMALDWQRADASGIGRGPSHPLPEPAWLALRCCCLAGPLPDGRRIACDSALVRRLAAGDTSAALAIALRRLQASGIRSPLRGGTTDATTARQWAAALVFPITPVMAEQAIAHLNPTH